VRPSDSSPYALGDDLDACRRALEDNPGDVRALLKIGDVWFRRGEHDRALSAYERGAELYVRNGHFVKAIAVFKQMHWLIERHAPELAARYRYTEERLAGIFEHVGLVDDALHLWRSVARHHADEGRDAQAIEILSRVVAMATRDVSARMMLAALRVRAGDADGAVTLLEQAVTIAIGHGQQNDALAALRRLLALRENADHARLAAELLLERDGEGDAVEALAKLSVAYRANPRSLPTLRLLVRAFDHIGAGDKANAVLKESARIVHESGAKDSFARIVEALLSRAPDDPEVHELARMPAPSSASKLKSSPRR
jgi:tetratricopeptide (TPR) repeat protein